MITREQVADLRPGDVVRMTTADWPEGYALEGPLSTSVNGALRLTTPHGNESYVLRDADGSAWFGERRSLTVISRAPRPLYVNHDRMGPVPGDVVRDADGPSPATWVFTDRTSSNPWFGPRPSLRGRTFQYRETLPDRLHLLVDGETGQVVP